MNTMKQRPILFSRAMILAIIANRKQQTRRVIHPQPDRNLTSLAHVRGGPVKVIAMREGRYSIFCQFGQPGDELWVQETHTITEWKERWDTAAITREVRLCGYYDADQTPFAITLTEHEAALFDKRKRKLATVPGRFMYRSLSRMSLEITDIQVERLQSISEQDAIAEGVQRGWYDDQGETPGRYLYFTDVTPAGKGHATAKDAYRELWNSIHGKSHPWEANEWLWCISFKRKEEQ